MTLGHEFSGAVSEVGEGVTGLAKGDNVVVEPYFVHAVCDMCQAGSYTCAGRWASLGSPAAGEG
ncbi:threonine dehydrogenase-like Zn-dependent dehydrogenase [Arthrobacter globiformis]|nr:threonine dehydrogenase-like Zn-dependent dehydrogenase [Arthrobacter globiformis]